MTDMMIVATDISEDCHVVATGKIVATDILRDCSPGPNGHEDHDFSDGSDMRISCGGDGHEDCSDGHEYCCD